MEQHLYSILIPIASVIAGLSVSGILVIIVKGIVKRAINNFIEKVLKPKAEEVLPNEKIDRIEKSVYDIKKEIMEMRGKLK